jgi:hypothetical protein
VISTFDPLAVEPSVEPDFESGDFDEDEEDLLEGLDLLSEDFDPGREDE